MLILSHGRRSKVGTKRLCRHGRLTSGALLGGLGLAVFWRQGRATPVIGGMLVSLACMTAIQVLPRLNWSKDFWMRTVGTEIFWPWYTLWMIALAPLVTSRSLSATLTMTLSFGSILTVPWLCSAGRTGCPKAQISSCEPLGFT